MKIILASKSPRRAEILKNIGAEFEIMPADTDEYVPDGTSPEEAVKMISAGKAECIAEKNGGADTLIVSADTVVVYGGEIIGKPKDETHAFEILKRLSGHTHAVYTGFTLRLGDKAYSDFEKTEVDFRMLSDDEIYRYIKSGEPMDKAGAYGIQEKGAVFVSGIRGDYFNVMGLPICRINETAKKIFGVRLANL